MPCRRRNMTGRRIVPLTLLSLMLSAVMLGCGDSAPMLVSQEQEVEVGQRMARQIEQEERVVQSGHYARRLDSVARPLLRETERDVPYSVEAIESDEINAFALPGGPTYYYTGLMDRMSEDPELAFIVGHELSHIEHEHQRRAINNAVVASTAASVLLGDSSDLLNFAANVMYTLWSRGYGRDQEREADAEGVRMMARAGFQPRAALDALEKLGGGSQSGLTEWLATHPSTPERIQRLERLIAQEYRR